MRTLGIDPGQRRVGLAISDAGGSLASAYDVLHVGSLCASIPQILKVIETEGVERLVIGLPLNMDGSRGPAANESLQFGRALQKASGKPTLFVDERLSSFEAEQQLISRKRSGEKITRKQKKNRLDALAAASFLQAFLDGGETLNDQP